MTTLDTFDPLDFVKLPDPGGYISRKPKPCGECGETFQVVRIAREATGSDGQPRRTVSVACQCPNMYEHRRERVPAGLSVIGRFDVRTGEMRIDANGAHR